MKLVRVSRGWFETQDGRYAVLKSHDVWRVATLVDRGTWTSEVYRTKRDAVASVARRLTQERTDS
jgi:hypothetical protein